MCERSTALAPGLQSSPIKFGNTIVFNPHGIHATITATGYTALGNGNSAFTPTQIKNTVAGKINKRNTQNTTVLTSGKTSRQTKDASTNPVRIMLNGPVQFDAYISVVVTMLGIESFVMPTIIPRIIVTVIGLSNFLAKFASDEVSNAYPKVYVYMANGMQNSIMSVSACEPNTASTSTYPKYS